MKKILALTTLTLLLTACGNSTAPGEEGVVKHGDFELSAESVAIGEEITVFYDLSGKIEADAWIGVVPSETPKDEASAGAVNLDVRYLNGTPNGRITFISPGEAGEYDIRAYSSSEDGKLLESESFTVTPGSEPEMTEETDTEPKEATAEPSADEIPPEIPTTETPVE